MSRAEQDNSDLRLMELAARNPSLGGRELMREIIERGPMPEENERPQARDLRSALKAPSLDDPDYRTRIEHADWLGKESQTTRDLYERGAEIKGDVLTIPAEEYELLDDRETPFITTLSHAQERIGNIEQAREFHSLALAMSGETADARMQIAVFKHYYDRIERDERRNRFGRNHEAKRLEVLNRTLEEMRAIAAEMAKLETRESFEAVEAEKIKVFDSTSDRDVEVAAGGMNVSARKVNLRDESLRLPAGLNYETKERLLGLTTPETDRRLENGVSRESIFKAIDNTMFQRDARDLSDRELKERGRIAGFLKGYVDERLRDPETRALNTSAVFREARAAIINSTTPEGLGRVAASILRSNEQRSEELRRYYAAPDRHPLPAVMPLNARERNLLFNGRAPDHHTREMRELRLNYGLSRAERAERIADLREGRIEPSEALNSMLQELETRRTTRAIAHFQASILNEKMDKAGRINLRSLHQQIPPHERTYLFELCEERKKNLQRESRTDRADVTGPSGRADGQSPGRAFGVAPKESRSFREYMSHMGRIERQLLNEAVSRLATRPDHEQNNLTITEARNLLPEKTRDEIRLRARNLAWQNLTPDEVFEREPLPEALRISETIAHIQESLQNRASIAQAARNDFVAEKVRLAEERSNDERAPLRAPEEERKQFVQTALDSLSPADVRRLAELDRYAVQTREEMYRGFEILDSQWRELELKRAQYHSRPKEAGSWRGFSLPVTSETSKPGELKFEVAFVPVHGSFAVVHHQAGNGQRQPEKALSGLQAMYVHSDREWHFDSLHEALAVEMSSPQIETRDREDWQHQR
jgi:hypothetical protein